MRHASDVTLTLPPELKAEAKAAGLNLSRLLREAIERELAPIRRERHRQFLEDHFAKIAQEAAR